MENDEDLDTYVCITHRRIVPCGQSGHHLISNWVVDVRKIIDLMENT